MEILNLSLHNSNLPPLNDEGVFREVLQLKEMLELIFLTRQLVLNMNQTLIPLIRDMTSYTLGNELWRFENYLFKTKLFEKLEFKTIYKTHENMQRKFKVKKNNWKIKINKGRKITTENYTNSSKKTQLYSQELFLRVFNMLERFQKVIPTNPIIQESEVSG